MAISHLEPLYTPAELQSQVPVSTSVEAYVGQARAQIAQVLSSAPSVSSPRPHLIVVGPCSIHDTQAGLEYAHRLAGLQARLGSRCILIMRVYFEKPRTAIGWKGLITDPFLNGQLNLQEGLLRARTFLRQVLEMGLPTATEFLDPITPQYLGDLICWAAIGARNVHSQPHRLLASGLPMPVGFKNNLEGRISSAIDAVKAARKPHAYLGVDAQGRVCGVHTQGNPHTHLVLRGSLHNGPNYQPEHLAALQNALQDHPLEAKVLIDCSHGNSQKDPAQQPQVFASFLEQSRAGNPLLAGAMLESNLYPGAQPYPTDSKGLRYGVSITDACLGWEETEQLLRRAYTE